MKKKVLNLMTISLLSLFAFSCKNKDVQQQQVSNARPYPVAQVPERDVVGYDAYPAVIEGKVNNDVRAKIQGYIQRLYVDEGQVVKKGQALFKLETNVLTQDAGAARSAISAAQSSVDVAQVEVNRLTPLVQRGIIGEVQLETAKANLKMAQSNLQQAKASYSSIAANIDFSVVKSPVDGIVGSLPFKEGSLVGPSDPTPLTTISDVSEVYAYFSLNEREYFAFLGSVEGNSVKEKLANLPEVNLVLADGSIYPETGKISAATGQIDRATGTIQFRATFKNNGLLSNGNTGTIRIPKNYNNVLVVPEAATFEQQGLVYIYKIINDTAHSTQIELIDRVDRMALIKSGIQKGDQVVVSGITTMRDKAAVVPQPADMDSVINEIKPLF